MAVQKLVQNYLYGSGYVSSNQRCHWSLYHKRYRDTAWYHCDTSCADSKAVASWRFSSTSGTETWKGRIQVGLEATWPQEPLPLDRRSEDFWFHAHHWWVQWVHQVEYPTAMEKPYGEEMKPADFRFTWWLIITCITFLAINFKKLLKIRLEEIEKL